jgi:hypothetical protein
MKKILLAIVIVFSSTLYAQVDSAAVTNLVIQRDVRLDLLGKKLAEINAVEKKIIERSAMGYRLQILSTNDREYAMKTRSALLARFPEQKTYMFFQSPYVKLRFGNFRTKQEAEVYKKQISRMLGGTSIYTVSERIEVKPEKDKEKEDEDD